MSVEMRMNRYFKEASSQKKMFASRTYGRPLKAIPTQGGYRISGRAPLVSNCQDANWIAMTAIVMDGKHADKKDQIRPEMVMVYFPREECEVIDSGCSISVCPPCTKVRGYTADDLLDGVTIIGSIAIHQPIKEGAAVMTF